MPESTPPIRVLIVDDNRDGADALGLVVEALGHRVHVTYGGLQAINVANAFRPHLMLIDLAMPEIDGCVLVQRFRQNPEFKGTRIAAITGHTDQGHKTMALKAGFDVVVFKPVALNELEEVIASVRVTEPDRPTAMPPDEASPPGVSRLSISAARRLRNERSSKTLTVVESEAAICDGIQRFQDEYLGWKSQRVRAHFIKDLLLVRIQDALTVAERQLGQSALAPNGRDLIKEVRRQLLELARPMLESMIHEVTGVKVLSMHHDLSTVTGEEVIGFSLVTTPKFD